MPNETQLICALARTNISKAAFQRASRLIGDSLDWHRVVQAAIDHDVVAPVYLNIKRRLTRAVPAPMLRTLRSTYLAQFRTSLQIRGELKRILDLLSAHEIEAVPFKGPVLAAQAYDDPNMRTFSDLDLLVRPQDVDRTDEALQAEGFEAKDPLPKTYDTHWSHYAPWHALHGNAVGYVRDPGTPGALHVDLHWGLASRYFMFPMHTAEIWERLVPVALENGYTVATFSPEDTLLFLCMHATKDSWEKLSLVCDIAELLRTHHHIDHTWVLQKAETVRSVKMVLLGLYLAHRVLNAPLPVPIRHRLNAWDEREKVADRARTLLLKSPRGPRRLWNAICLHMLIRDRWSDGRGAAFHQIQLAFRPTAEDRAWVELPAGLDFMYVFLRPLRKLLELTPVASDESQSDPSVR